MLGSRYTELNLSDEALCPLPFRHDRSQHPIDTEPDAVHLFGIEIREQPGETVPLITLTYNGRTLRQIPAFGVAQHDQAETKFKIGMMGCSPLSSGCKVTFEGIELQSD